MSALLRMKLIQCQSARSCLFGFRKSGYTKAMDSFHKELILEIEQLKKQLEKLMDKQIKKVKKDVEKGNKTKAKKDITKLMAMDKKMDAKVAKCDMMKSKKKR